MEGEALSNRPESPKKKIKSNPPADSEAQPSNYSESSSSNDERNSTHVNGLTPTRKGRFSASVPDSSSERSQNEHQENRSPPRIQEEEVSSSENSVGKKKEVHGSLTEGDADSISKESEDFTSICDSASSDSTSSDSNDKH